MPNNQGKNENGNENVENVPADDCEIFFENKDENKNQVEQETQTEDDHLSMSNESKKERGWSMNALGCAGIGAIGVGCAGFAATGAVLTAIGLSPAGPIGGSWFAVNMGAGLTAGSWMSLLQSAAMTGVAKACGAGVTGVTGAYTGAVTGDWIGEKLGALMGKGKASVEKQAPLGNRFPEKSENEPERDIQKTSTGTQTEIEDTSENEEQDSNEKLTTDKKDK